MAIMKTQDPEEYFKEVKKAAERGEPDAQAELGMAYIAGFMVEQDEKLGIKWLIKAMEQGSPVAQNKIGTYYDMGLYGFAQDPVEAVKLYRAAAMQGYGPAQANLADSYFSGIGVEQDVVKAIEWYRQAADRGEEEASHALFEIMENCMLLPVKTQDEYREAMRKDLPALRKKSSEPKPGG